MVSFEEYVHYYERKNFQRELKKEISKKASMANKRLKRLEKNNLTNTPAYRQFIQSGGQKFSVKGKNTNELQAELARVNRFINAESSTVRGANRMAKRIANQVGLEYGNTEEVIKMLPSFFELTSKVEQYLNSIGNMANAIGYQKIWQSVNTYIQTAKIDLSNSNTNIEQLTKAVSDLIHAEKIDEDEEEWWSSFK